MVLFRFRYFEFSMKKIALLIYRLVTPFFDPIHVWHGFFGYFRFWVQFFQTRKHLKGWEMPLLDLYPQPQDATKHTPMDAHYFYQQLWCFDHVLAQAPKHHLDVGSTYQMSGYISRITHAIFMDIRPIQADLNNLEVVDGSILQPPFEKESFSSISCLHVIEHIGLWRYGDPLDIDGSKKACHELAKLLKTGGLLYVSVPIGRERICFNAHRVFNPETIVKYFHNLELLDFSLVNDNKNFIEHADYKQFDHLEYGCGMFIFTKK